MIYCACEKAKPKCDENCSRWPGEIKPDKVYKVPWPKTLKENNWKIMRREEW